MPPALFSLAGKTALVTGASSGLGEHFARVLAAAGATVVLGARRVERLQRLEAEIRAGGGRAWAVPLDVTDRASVVRAFDAAEAVAGPVTVLVNNAGASSVSVLDVQARRIVQRIEVGPQPIAIRMHPDGRRAFVASEVSGSLTMLELPGLPVRPAEPRNEVIVLGMIHGEHRTSERYGLEVLRRLLREIRPDYALTEIPPNRFEVATKVVVPAALSGIIGAFILATSRAVGETMIVAIAAGLQPNLSWNPFEGMATMTAYIVNVSLGDTPRGTLEYSTIFAVGMLLFLCTLVLNILAQWLLKRFREVYE